MCFYLTGIFKSIQFSWIVGKSLSIVLSMILCLYVHVNMSGHVALFGKPVSAFSQSWLIINDLQSLSESQCAS